MKAIDNMKETMKTADHMTRGDKVKSFDRLAGFWSILAIFMLVAACIAYFIYGLLQSVCLGAVAFAMMAVANTYWILADIVMIKRKLEIKPE